MADGEGLLEKALADDHRFPDDLGIYRVEEPTDDTPNDGGDFDLAALMLRFTFPYLFFVSLTAFAGGVLNTYGRFGVPAFTPVILNVVLIAAAIWAAPLLEQPIMALAYAVFVAGLAQLLFQLPFLARIHALPRPRWRPRCAGPRRRDAGPGAS